MANFGDIDSKQFDKFVSKIGDEAKTKHLLKLTSMRMSAISNAEIADVKKRTPVDTGTLRRAWQRGPVQFISDGVQVKLSNNTEYAPYVENGHRTRGHNSWVEGQFFFKNSLNDLQETYNGSKWQKWLQDYFNQLYPRN